MEQRDKIYFGVMVIGLLAYIYFLYRMDKRSRQFDQAILKGMLIAPVEFTEGGKIDDTKDSK